jgi:F-type H+-transporting ATPase subunit gamma
MGMQQLKEDLGELISFDDFSIVMKSMASIKYPKFKKKLDGFRDFASSVEENLLLAYNSFNPEDVTSAKLKKELDDYKGVSKHLEIEEGHGLQAFFETSKNNNTLIIIITANLGFCGKYNREVLNKSDEVIADIENKSKSKIELICIGKKACNYFLTKRQIPPENLKDFPEKNEKEKTELSNSLLRKMLDPFLKGDISNIKVIYQSFSEFPQIKIEPRVLDILPIPHFELKKEVEPEETGSERKETVFEPSPLICLSYLIRESLFSSLMNCFIEAETAEHYSRMIAMNQASESIKEMLNKKESEIRKFRQNLITKELVEIISGAEALKNKEN